MSKWKLHASSAAAEPGSVAVPVPELLLAPSSADSDQFDNNGGEQSKRSGRGLPAGPEETPAPAFASPLHRPSPDGAGHGHAGVAVEKAEMLRTTTAAVAAAAGRLLSRVCVADSEGFLDGASSSARVGLDIGGTLCKVVYFEPDVDLPLNVDSPSLLLKQQRHQHQHHHSHSDSQEHCSSNSSSNFSAKESSGLSLSEAQEEAPRSRFPSAAEFEFESGSGSSKVVVSGGKWGRNGYHSEERGMEGHNALCRSRENATSHYDTAKHTDAAPAATAVDASIPDSNKAAATAAAAADGLVNTGSHDGLGNGNERGNRWAAACTGGGMVSESCRCSCGPGPPPTAAGVLQGSSSSPSSGLESDDGGRMMMAGVESDQKARTQAQKIWVSSHEPVNLSGRGTLYFKCFETWQMEEFLNLTKELQLMTAGQAIGATGGGARKFGDRFLEIAGLNLQRADELKSLVCGIDFLVRNAHHENFEYPSGPYQGGSIQRPLASPEDSSDEGCGDNVCKDEISVNVWKASGDSPFPSTSENGQQGHNKVSAKSSGQTKLTRPPVIARLDSGIWTGRSEPLHPYLVVNIGSGVSILRVESPDIFERVGGTSLGGSTFLGLAKALTGCQSFEEALSLATQGDSTNVDMLVGDIYGGDYTEMGLAATTVASSFGKLVQPRQNNEAQQPQHLAKAALLMVTNNIGSIAWLHARDVHSVMFTGSFLHNNKLAMRLLAVAMEFWSKGKMKAVFLRHEGHAGAMGALLNSLDSSNPLDALLLS